MRICDRYGTGFFGIPGTDTCLRISGAMRLEYTARANAPTDNAFARSANLSGQVYDRDEGAFRGRAYLNADARTETPYGTLRTFVSYRITQESTLPGPSGGGSVTPFGSLLPQKTSFFQGFNGSSYTLLDKGFIQFAGMTAGRAQSFFDFDAQSHELLTSSMANSNQVTQLFAYTATFGNGFSATISAEDRNERIIADSGAVPANLNPTDTKAGYLAYAGERAPDVVANLRLDQDWIAAQLAAAYHDVSSQAVTLPGGATITPRDRAGFAGLAGVRVLLPFLAKGDNLTLQGTYESGAMDYINSLNYYNGLTNIYSHDLAVSVPVNDGFVLPGGRIGLNRGLGGYGALQHYWSENWNSSLFGSLVRIQNPVAAQLISGSGTGDNARIVQVGGNLIWSPVKDLLIGGELLYSNLKLSGAAPLATGGTGPSGGKVAVPAQSDDVRGRLSVRRAF